ncbi:MAG: peptidoglycan editing factor PgeF [Deltaproteobacteria bacterium]|nr:peptidoglycan editing factor PgeF [Deltaproteobacteria bacterium]
MSGLPVLIARGPARYLELPALTVTGLVEHAFLGRPADGGRPIGPRRLGGLFGLPQGRAMVVRQVHGTAILPVHADVSPDGATSRLPYDGLVTVRRDVALAVASADCVPLLLLDPVRRAVGAVHAGWRGSSQGIAQEAVAAMSRHFGTHPRDLLVGIGPSIGPCCYEVGEEVVEAFRARFSHWGRYVRPKPGAKAWLDLWEANRVQLEEAGVLPERLTLAGLCTACHRELFHSYRREGKAGVQLSFIRLR